MDSTSVVAYFDGVAGSYDQVLPFFGEFAGQALRRIGPGVGGEALDLAAGRGAFTAGLLARGCEVTAVDGSARMVEFLRREHPAVRAYVMDAARLDLAADRFDLVVCGFAVHIVADPCAVLAEAVRVAKPGGMLAFTVPGRADGGADPWVDPLVELFADYRRFQVDGCGRLGNGADESELFGRSGLAEVSATTLEVALPVPDGETYWRWSRSHGYGRFIDGLPVEKRREMHSRLVASVAATAAFTLRRSATLWTGRKVEGGSGAAS